MTRGTWLELSRNQNSVTEETFRFSFFQYDKVYNIFFRLLSSESPIFIFNHVAQYKRYNFISSNGRK